MIQALRVMHFTLLERLRTIILTEFYSKDVATLVIHYMVFLHMSWWSVCGENLTTAELYVYNVVPSDLLQFFGWIAGLGCIEILYPTGSQ